MTIIDLISIIILMLLLAYSVIKKYIDEKNGIDNSKTESKIDEFCNKHYKKIWIVFIIILFFTVVYKFGEIPTYLGCDEAGMAYDAYCLSEYGTDRYMNQYPLYLTNFGQGQSSLCAYLAVIFIKILGPNVIAYRMPMLLVYIVSVIASYLMVSKFKNKKFALLFTFLIITCPWNIFNTRMALDCNLYLGMFMIALYFMTRAEKTYQFFIAGIFVGLNLYTYCLAWITMPIFLAVWIVYMLNIKRINWKQIIVMGIPIAILALPLIYFLLLNYGIVKQTDIGIFSLPVLDTFRAEQISPLNIFKTGLESLKVIFMSEGTIYLLYVPLFIIGFILSFKNVVQSIKEKKFDLTTVMVIAFVTLLIGLLFTRIPTANKANVLYFLILYFVAVAIIKICENSYLSKIIMLITICSLFINFTWNYFKVDGVSGDNWYEDRYLYSLTEEIEANERYANMGKYIISYKAAPYIYVMLGTRMSPQEYMETQEIVDYGNNRTEIAKIGDYNFIYKSNEFDEVVNNKENGIFIISNRYENEIKELQEQGYTRQDYGYYAVMTKEE